MKQKIWRTAVCAALSALLLCALGTGVFAAQEPLRFSGDGTFKIMVLADMQDTQLTAPVLTRIVGEMLDEEQPDFVVYLGDQLDGANLLLRLGDVEQNVLRTIDNVTAPVTQRGIPFAVVFGNHDGGDSGVAKELQMAHYMEMPGCLAVDEGSALPGCGTYLLPVQGSDGKTVLNLWFFDSQEYGENGGYGSVSKEQIAWYQATAAQQKAENGGERIPALAFQHIIVPEVYDVLTEVQKGETDDAIAGKGYGAGRYFSFERTKQLSSFMVWGEMNEAPCPPDETTGEAAAWVESGDIFAAFFGHDHVNHFSVLYDNIELNACPGATYVSYGSGAERGVRVITLRESDFADGGTGCEKRDLFFADYETAADFFLKPHTWYIGAALVLLAGVFCAVFFPIRAAVRRKRKVKETV